MRNKIFYIAVLSCIMTAACSEAIPEGFSVDNPESYSKIYLGEAFHGNRQITLLPEKDEVLDICANYGGLVDLDVPVSVTLGVREDLISQYNAEMGTNYLPFPESNYRFSGNTVTISAGKSYSDIVRLSISSDNLNGRGPYMLPVSIVHVSGKNIPVSKDLETLFIVMEYDDSAFDYPSYDRTGWKFLEATTCTEGNIGNILDSDRFTYVDCKAEQTHVMTLDMGNSVRVHGVAFTSRIRLINGDEYHYAGQPRVITLEISEDNENWTTVINKGVVPFGIESSLRINEYLDARYVKLTVEQTWITKNHKGTALSFSEFNVF